MKNESIIRTIIQTAMSAYSSGFSDRHILEVDDENGVINMKIHNVFIAALGSDIQYYSALSRSLDSSLGNMIEAMAISIAKINYDVKKYVEGDLYKEQTEHIADLLEQYKSHVKNPSVEDYKDIVKKRSISTAFSKRHESDYCLYDKETGRYYLIELKIGGDLDNKKARSEKEALLEQYCILSNSLNSQEKVKIYFATAYNRYGEGKPWTQSRVRQFFAEEELLISAKFWNMVCKSEEGYDVVIDEYKKNAYLIVEALQKIKKAYLPEN